MPREDCTSRSSAKSAFGAALPRDAFGRYTRAADSARFVPEDAMTRPPEAASEARPLTPVRLRYRRQELLITDGSYLLGRDPSCHIVIDRPLISRRHARVSVQGERVSVEDLGSMNGVFVNGSRVSGTRTVYDGDWLTLGSEEIELLIGSARGRTPIETQADRESIRPGTDQEVVRISSSPPEDERPTERSRTLEILSAIADRAFAAGRARDAEDMLKLTLLDLLHEATSGHALDPDARLFAVRYGLRLAQATESARWFEYAIDLLRAERVPCSQEVASELRAVLQRISDFDLERLRAYAGSLRTLTSDIESLKSSQRVEELVREAAARRSV
jgi:pSer/pThr/pTyr-binding forkhead associated (FHA) protein